MLCLIEKDPGPLRITVLNYTVYCTGLDDRKKGKTIVPFQLYKTYARIERPFAKNIKSMVSETLLLSTKRYKKNRLISVSNLLGSELQSLWPQYGLMAPP